MDKILYLSINNGWKNMLENVIAKPTKGDRTNDIGQNIHPTGNEGWLSLTIDLLHIPLSPPDILTFFIKIATFEINVFRVYGNLSVSAATDICRNSSSIIDAVIFKLSEEL
ncbi:hypothetical protein TNCT_664301 [Trichonephila clavata]|uniref:Uncharacterized protein n=1 Tax=Trichonephila clavata TaxID=2740835 RepID=A0A8X6LD14_TRICU|nr:hypothetical protein TNCT_664301 [Trichonephila clavata]